MHLVILFIPCFWAMFLVGEVLVRGLSWGLEFVPVEWLVSLGEWAFPMAIFGSILALAGNFFQLDEMLKNKTGERDAIFMGLGGTLVLLAFIIMPAWPMVLGVSIWALITMSLLASCLGRIIMDRTETVFSTLAMLAVFFTGLGVLTWLVF